MIFNTPTTKDEMYDTLKQIFYFYRISICVSVISHAIYFYTAIYR